MNRQRLAESAFSNFCWRGKWVYNSRSSIQSPRARAASHFCFGWTAEIASEVYWEFS